MKKNISLLLAVLMILVSICGTTVTASAADIQADKNAVDILPVALDSDTIINESGYLETSADYYAMASVQKNFPKQQFKVLVNFKTASGTGSATLELGDNFSRTIPCDGKSQIITFDASYSQGILIWAITNHPAGMAYVVQLYPAN